MNRDEAKALHEAVLAACGEVGPSGWHESAWRSLAEMGVSALPVAESAGGAGADLVTATVALIALGSIGVSVPIVETGLVAGWLLEQAQARLPDGVVTAAIGELDLRHNGAGWLAGGTLTRVPWARVADYVVLLGNADGAQLVVVAPLAEARITPSANVAGEPRDDVSFDQVAVTAYELAAVTPNQLLRRAAFGRSALMAGAAQGIYAYAARYAGERVQFGRPLAALQAVQQMLAELAGEVSAMTVAVEAAAAAVDASPERSWVLDAARIRVAAGAGTVGAIGHQILGAIGFTDEHPLYCLTTRMWAWREEYGNQTAWRQRLGALLGEEGGDSLWRLITS